MSARVRITCLGTLLASCLATPDWEVSTTYVHTDNTGQADSVSACDAHLASAVREVSGWNAGYEVVELRPWVDRDAS